jgi:hypothetical protein
MTCGSNLKTALLATALVWPLSPLAQTTCSRADAERFETIAKAAVDALPRVNYSASRRARFKVAEAQSTEALELTFSNKRRTLFTQTLNLQEMAPDVAPGCRLEGRPAHGRPANGLFLRLACQAPQIAPRCAIVIQPGINRGGESGWTYRVIADRSKKSAR